MWKLCGCKHEEAAALPHRNVRAAEEVDERQKGMPLGSIIASSREVDGASIVRALRGELSFGSTSLLSAVGALEEKVSRAHCVFRVGCAQAIRNTEYDS